MSYLRFASRVLPTVVVDDFCTENNPAFTADLGFENTSAPFDVLLSTTPDLLPDVTIAGVENWINLDTQFPWVRSTANPRSGSRHARCTITDIGNFPQSDGLFVVGTRLCDMSVDAFGGSRVSAGDTITFSLYAEASTTADDVRLNLSLACYQITSPTAVSNKGFTIDTTAVAGSYTQHTVSMVAPADSDYVRIVVDAQLYSAQTVPVTLDIDDAALTIA